MSAFLTNLQGLLLRWNFIERAKLESQLWEAFERGKPLEEIVEQCPPGFQKEVWSSTLVRIRKIEKMMQGKTAPAVKPDSD
jgi:hypothetical protein